MSSTETDEMVELASQLRESSPLQLGSQTEMAQDLAYA